MIVIIMTIIIVIIMIIIIITTTGVMRSQYFLTRFLEVSSSLCPASQNIPTVMITTMMIMIRCEIIIIMRTKRHSEQ